MNEDRSTATVYYWGDEAHDGAGFYYVDDEYPDEGSVGAFATLQEAVEHAKEAEYEVCVSADARARSVP